MDEAKKEFLMNRINASPFNLHNGIRAVSVDEGVSTVCCTLTDASRNIWGIPHGGILFALGDVAAGLALQSVCEESTITMNGTINFLTAARNTAHVYGHGQVVKKGRSTAFVEVALTDDHDIKIAIGQYVMHLS